MSERIQADQILTSLRSVSKHWIVYGLGSTLSRLVGFLMLPVYTRFLSPAEYGIRAMVVVSMNIAMIILTQGIRQAVIRFYWDDKQNAHPEVVSTGLVAAAGMAALGVTIALRFSHPLAELIFGAPGFASYMQLGLVAFFFSTILEIPLAYLQLLKRSVMFSVISVAMLIASLFLNIFFVIILGSGVLGIFYTEVIINAFFCLMLVGLTSREVGWSFSSQTFGTMIRYGTPTLFVGLGWLVINTVDRLFLNRYSSLSDVGIYSLANQFAQVLLVVLLRPFLNVWGPAQFEVNRQSNATELFPRLFHFFTSVLLIAAFTLSIFIEDVMRIVVAPPFWSAASLVPILALSPVLMGVHSLLNTGILIKKRTEFAGLISLVACGLSVSLNFLLIPTYLAAGAAVSRACSLLAVVGMTYWVSQRVYPIDFKVSASFKTFGYTLGLFILSRYIPSEPRFVSLVLKMSLIVSLLALILRSDVWRESDRERLKSISREILLRLHVGSGWQKEGRIEE